MRLGLVFAALMLTSSADAQVPTSTPTVAAVAPAPRAQQDPDQRVECRRVEVTGSLIGNARSCKTVAEWRRLGDRGNDYAREAVDNLRGRPGGNN